VYALGRAEEILGESLSGVRRSDYVLASKVFWPTGEGPNDRGLSRKHIIESCHASLRRLRTDYLDLYQAHRFDPTVPLEETLRAFDDLVRAGKVLYIGVSEWTAGQMSHALRIAGGRGFDRLVSNQPQYSMLWRVIEAEVVPLCRAEGIGQIVWSPLAQGVLTGKYAPGSTPPKGSRATDQRGAQFIREFMTNDLLGRVQELRPVAAEAGLSMAALAVAWVLQNDTVSAAIIGASRPEQVTENVQGGGVRLDKELMTRIDEILDPVVQRNPALTGD
jgi:aryl-alcohol dehydrogenase-like predicted oxidoreductase